MQNAKGEVGDGFPFFCGEKRGEVRSLKSEVRSEDSEGGKFEVRSEDSERGWDCRACVGE